MGMSGGDLKEKLDCLKAIQQEKHKAAAMNFIVIIFNTNITASVVDKSLDGTTYADITKIHTQVYVFL